MHDHGWVDNIDTTVCPGDYIHTFNGQHLVLKPFLAKKCQSCFDMREDDSIDQCELDKGHDGPHKSNGIGWQYK